MDKQVVSPSVYSTIKYFTAKYEVYVMKFSICVVGFETFEYNVDLSPSMAPSRCYVITDRRV